MGAGVTGVPAGQPLDEFFRQRIFAPLGMNHTSFLPTARISPRCTGAAGERKAVRHNAFGAVGRGRPELSGGGGLVATAADHHRFTQFLL